ncbi:hypothetical protein [Nostoc sp.]
MSAQIAIIAIVRSQHFRYLGKQAPKKPCDRVVSLAMTYSRITL